MYWKALLSKLLTHALEYTLLLAKLLYLASESKTECMKSVLQLSDRYSYLYFIDFDGPVTAAVVNFQ